MREKSTSFKSLFGGLFAIGLIVLFVVFQFNLFDLSMLPSFDHSGELSVVTELDAAGSVQILNAVEDVDSQFQLTSVELDSATIQTASIREAVKMIAGPPCDEIDCAATGMPFTVASTSCFALPESGEYGKITGGDQSHVNEIEYCFGGQSGNVDISFDMWDIDFTGEVAIYVNGQLITNNLAVTPNNTWINSYSVTLPDVHVNDGSTNILQFTNTYNPPYEFLWGIRNVQHSTSSSCSPGFELPEAGEYGKISGGDQNHVNEIEYCFNGQNGNVDISFEAWDIDYSTEVAIYINGQLVTNNLSVTSDNAWGNSESITLLDAEVNDTGTNVLKFTNTYNPPYAFLWGIRNVQHSSSSTCSPGFEIPEAGEYGMISGGDQSHTNEIEYCFDGQSGDVAIAFEAYDIDFVDEVWIYVNGQFVDTIAPTTDGSWGSMEAVTLPDSLVNDTSINILLFTNNYNPPYAFFWGIRSVDFSIIAAGVNSYTPAEKREQPSVTEDFVQKEMNYRVKIFLPLVQEQ